MKLPPGATGFGVAPGGGVDLRAFTAVCHHAARAVGAAVSRIVPAGVTPSFHSAEIVRRGLRTVVLGHATVAVVAFAEPGAPGGVGTTFTDRPDLAAAVREVSDLRILTAGQLDAPVTTADLDDLAVGERDQIAYWRPATVGELIFNHWD